MKDALRVIDLYPRRLTRAERAWVTGKWSSRNVAEVLDMLLHVVPDMTDQLIQQSGRNKGAPNIGIELSDHDDDAELTFTTVRVTRYAGYNETTGEDHYEEESTEHLCDFDELRDVFDDSAGCLTVNLTKLAAASVVVPFD